MTDPIPHFETRPRRRRPVSPAFLLALVVCCSSLNAEDPAAEETNFESYNVILMLEQGPIHGRFRIALHGQPVSLQRQQFIDDLIRDLDENQDGRLTRTEANRSPVLRQNLSARLRRYAERRDLLAKQTVSLQDVQTTMRRLAGHPVMFRQSRLARDSDDFLFEFLDSDQSGTIEFSEMETAASRLVIRDADRDQCIGYDEVQASPETSDDGPFQETEEPERLQAVFSTILRRADERPLAERLIRKYDRDRNGALSTEELGWDASRVASIDEDQNGVLSTAELRRIQETPVDIDLSVDVAPQDSGIPGLVIRECTGARLDQVQRPGSASVQLRDTRITFSVRHIDPVADALENARVRFNVLDSDANGYLDMAEVENEPLLKLGLFAQLDNDNDEKIFSQEMDEYVARKAKAKSLACQVNVFDTGAGLFQSMDHNSDGRISTRELRHVTTSLQSLARDENPGISPDEPTRQFQIEFVQGTYRLFGGGERLTANSISFNTSSAVGPRWFVRSDRNNDGDLSWDEFFGHREDFHFLDADNDGLIDPVEALRAEELQTTGNTK